MGRDLAPTSSLLLGPWGSKDVGGEDSIAERDVSDDDVVKEGDDKA